MFFCYGAGITIRNGQWSDAASDAGVDPAADIDTPNGAIEIFSDRNIAGSFGQARLTSI